MQPRAKRRAHVPSQILPALAAGLMALWTIGSTLAAPVAHAAPAAQAAPPAAAPLDAAARALVIEGALRLLRERYFSPEVAERTAASVRARQAAGEYDAIAAGPQLAEALTRHLQETTRDKHVRVVYSAQPAPPPAGAPNTPSPAQLEQQRQTAAATNFGYVRVERLPGNVGYLRLDSFVAPALAADTAAAAMAFLAHTEALIIDLRENGGGSPAGVTLLVSYLLEGDPILVNTIHWRTTAGTEVQEFWSRADLPAPRNGTRPVYVLTSGRTFSGGEELAYDLKTLGRATLVGETTAGGANPGAQVRIDPHFAIFVPTGQAINPVTGTNWEGAGVAPDVAVPAEDAARTAFESALEAIRLRREREAPAMLAPLARVAEDFRRGRIALP